MPYASPGRADPLSDELLAAWNARINAVYDRLGDRQTRFFTLDVDAMENPIVVDNVSWLGHPAEPAHCGPEMSDPVVRELCDWGFRGRHVLQNEYCEYAVVRQPDRKGLLRPKRVQITTELREYWMVLAIHDPDRLRATASSMLAREVGWRELYGADPARLSPVERETAFAREVAGHGNERSLVERGVPDQPAGALNRENALFMTNPINGLDDLIYIVLFGARRFAVQTEQGDLREATIDEIFTDERKKGLACRHADPRAAQGAYDAVLAEYRIAFANPLGMYIRGEPQEGLLTYEGKPLPPSWIRSSRGEPGMRQRLELGPADDDDAFLDEILLSDGAASEPLTGGHQLVQRMDVGPLLAAVTTDPAEEHEFTRIDAAPRIDCAVEGNCRAVRELKADFDKAHAVKPAHRVPPR